MHFLLNHSCCPGKRGKPRRKRCLQCDPEDGWMKIVEVQVDDVGLSISWESKGNRWLIVP